MGRPGQLALIYQCTLQNRQIATRGRLLRSLQGRERPRRRVDRVAHPTLNLSQGRLKRVVLFVHDAISFAATLKGAVVVRRTRSLAQSAARLTRVTLSAPSPTLVLFKAGRATAHLRQNLELLACAAGATIETSYGERFLGSDCSGPGLPRTGDVALIVLCSQPYDRFTPARLATVRRRELVGAFHRLSLEVGPFISREEQGRVAETLEKSVTATRPPRAFVSRAVPPGDLEIVGEDGEADAWCSIVERLESEVDYRQALFVRLLTCPATSKVGVTSEITIAVSGPGSANAIFAVDLDSGQALLGRKTYDPDGRRFVVGITPTETAPIRGHLTVTTETTLPAAVPLQIDVASVGESAVDHAPEPDRVGHGAPPTEPRAPDGVLHVPAAGVKQILRDASSLEAEAIAIRLGELATNSAPGDLEIATATAALLVQAGAIARAGEILDHFEIGELPLTAQYHRFQAACERGDYDDVKELLEQLDFASPTQFETLLGALRRLPDGVAVPICTQLIDRVLDGHQALELFHQIRPRITQPEDIRRIADLIQALNPADALAFLVEHTEGRHPDAALLEQVMNLAREMEGNQAIGPQLKALCAIELERNDTDGAFRVLEVAERDATFAERLDIVNGIAAVLSKSSEQQYAGVELVERYANRALTEGMLPDAARLADQAAGLAAGDPTAEAVAADLSARVATALRSTDDVRSLLSLQAEHKYGISREKIAGRTLVIVGGTRDRDTEEQLKSTFGHRDVRWITSEKKKPADISNS